MKQYLSLAKAKYKSRKENLSKSKGTISGMLQRTKDFSEQLSELDKDLAKLGNEYISDNKSSNAEIEEIKKINYSLVSDFKNEPTNSSE